jgi:superfamily II RNA helicase
MGFAGTPFCCQEGLIRVLCTTETFAVGVNMPSRSIVFNWVAGNEFHKFDGTEQREIFVAEPWHPNAKPSNPKKM